MYESDRLLEQYLLFHYGDARQVLPYASGPSDALNFPARVVNECVDAERLRPPARALDLGCAVGRSSFELAGLCEQVLGIDYSNKFIDAARQLQAQGSIRSRIVEEGDIGIEVDFAVPPGLPRERVAFEVGDACNLRDDLGGFDVILMINLVDRLPAPARCLDRILDLMNPGGQLIVASPYTWMVDFTPRAEWLGGRSEAGGGEGDLRTWDALARILEPCCDLLARKDMPFLIREHSRKFQWSVADVGCWVRR